MKTILLIAIILSICACNGKEAKENKSVTQLATKIDKLDTDLDQLINPKAKIEVLAEGFKWVEGPLWVAEHQMLLFSDIPQNKIFKWTEKGGLEPYLEPSGYTGTKARGGEMGSNGLLLDLQGNLILCQHGDRCVSKMKAIITHPEPVYQPLASNWEGRKLNSPNDAAQRSNGDIFFTDPPYGLNDQQIEKKELEINGVYKVDTAGRLSLLIDTLDRPNGIALTPDEKRLIVGNSDNKKPMLYAFDIIEGDSLKPAGIVFDFSKYGGGPDGFKIDRKGNIFSSGPGGIWIFDRTYKPLGKININQPVSNCCLADDDKTLYITASNQLLRVRMR